MNTQSSGIKNGVAIAHYWLLGSTWLATGCEDRKMTSHVRCQCSTRELNVPYFGINVLCLELLMRAGNSMNCGNRLCSHKCRYHPIKLFRVFVRDRFAVVNPSALSERVLVLAEPESDGKYSYANQVHTARVKINLVRVYTQQLTRQIWFFVSNALLSRICSGFPAKRGHFLTLSAFAAPRCGCRNSMFGMELVTSGDKRKAARWTRAEPALEQ